MNLFYIAWRNMQHRGVATLLTMLSMSLGVALVVLVLSISWILTESFTRNSSVGYNMIVGAKGGSLQLVLNTVFYLSKPIEVIPYEDYLELIPGKEGRAKEIRKIGGRVAEPDRPGLFSGHTEGGFAIPVCMGDYYGPFRVVGTTSDFFEELRYGASADGEYTFQDGRNFVDYSEENGYHEAVLGSQVADFMEKKVGETFATTHGDPEGRGHGIEFKIVGILDATGTPNDRAAFINLEGFYKLDGHARGYVDQANPDEDKLDVPRAESDQPARLPLEKRDLTSVLVKTGDSMFAVFLMRDINKRLRTQAVAPGSEIGSLVETIAGPVRNAFYIVTFVVSAVSALSILVSIYNSMNERKRDIAVMRALGAGRDVVVSVVLLESMLVAVGGGLVGWLAGHWIGVAFSDYVEKSTGIAIGFFNTVTVYELWLIPGLVFLATVAGIVPAFVAYRTNVSQNLGS